MRTGDVVMLRRRIAQACFLAGWMAALVGGTTRLAADEAPQMPKPQKEHEWLQRFVGQWESEAEATLGPDQPPIKCKGTQTARLLGGFWMIAEGSAEMMGIPVQSVLTLGYDPAQQKYIGTWTDSCNHHMWNYAGEVSEDGTTLTLRTEGPNLSIPGKTSQYREVIEFKSEDHYVFSSMLEGDDGQWLTFMKADFRRKK